MKGFFSKEQSQPKSGIMRGYSCVTCGLYKRSQNPKMTPYGGNKKQIMVIGEWPTREDDEKGELWQGKTGRVFKRKCKKFGIDLLEDCVSLNAVNCLPIDKDGIPKLPTEYEISCCRAQVFNAIREYKPKVILLLGEPAVISVIGHQWKKNLGGIMKWRGWTIPDRLSRAWVCPTFSPSFVEEKKHENYVGIEAVWENDLKRAFERVDQPFFPHKKERDSVVITDDIKGVLRYIWKAKPKMMAFDIETTGIKPYNKKNHKIVSISFCFENNKAYAIPFPTQPKHLKLLKRILEHKKIGKIAANMKFEDNWLTTMCDINVYPWLLDTMQMTHILDNRPGITGLKFQSFVRFGLVGYDEDIEPYLKSPQPNIPNEIMKVVNNPALFKKLLLYNGIDSLMTYRLAVTQMIDIERENL